MVEITISVVKITELDDVDTFVIGFYDDLESPTDGFELQVGIETDPDDPDEKDRYCITTLNGVTHYAGVSSCILTDKILTLSFLPEAEKVFGVDGTKVNLEIDDNTIEQLRTALKRVFLGTKYQPNQLVLD